MKDRIIERAWFTMFGAVIVFLAMSFYMTSKYGRMVNHVHCDMSLTALGSDDASHKEYYRRSSTHYKTE